MKQSLINNYLSNSYNKRLNTYNLCTDNISINFLYSVEPQNFISWLNKFKQILAHNTDSQYTINITYLTCSSVHQYFDNVFENIASPPALDEIKELPFNKYISIKQWNKIILFKVKDNLIVIDSESHEMLFINKYSEVDDFFLSMIKYFVASLFVYFYDVYVIHGNLIEYQSENYLITNTENSGKTSFSLLFWINGGNWLTDDITYMNSNGEFVLDSFRSYTNIRKGSFKAFNKYLPNIKDSILDENTEEYMLNFEYFKYSKLPLKNKVDVIVLPNINKNNTVTNVMQEVEVNMMDLSFSEAPTIKLFSLLFTKHKRKYKEPAFLKQTPIYSVVTGYNYMNEFHEIINKVR